MSNKRYDNKDMIKLMSEAFLEGYKYAVEYAHAVVEKINKEHLAKHKKILKGVLQSLMDGAAALSKDDLEKAAEDYLREKHVREEIMHGIEDKTEIVKPSEQHIKDYGKGGLK